MKPYKIIALLIVLFVTYTSQLNAQNSSIEGEWLLEQIINHEENKAEPVYQPFSFTNTGELLIKNHPFGKWASNSKKNSLTIEAERIGGTYLITTLSKNELELTLNSKVLYFSKINKEQLIKDNKTSGLIGVWELQTEENHVRNLIEFKEPDEISFVEMDGSYKGRSSGFWFYKPKSKELIIIGQIKHFQGLNIITSISTNEVDIKNKGIEYILKVAEQVPTKIERLTFTEEDFYTENGAFKYEEDSSKLPWNEYYEMYLSLNNIHKIIYQYDLLEKSTNTFETKILEALVSTNIENDTFKIDNIFNGYDRNSVYEDQEFPDNEYDAFTPLYPCTASTFRVIGEEEIEVPAGTFQCVVVEAVGDFDRRLKIYMIKDQPGIIAKIISDKPENFGHYAIYTLKEIIIK